MYRYIVSNHMIVKLYCYSHRHHAWNRPWCNIHIKTYIHLVKMSTNADKIQNNEKCWTRQKLNIEDPAVDNFILIWILNSIIRRYGILWQRLNVFIWMFSLRINWLSYTSLKYLSIAKERKKGRSVLVLVFSK